MRLRLRFWRKEPTWLGDWAPEAKPPPVVTRFPGGGVLSFGGRASELEIVVGALNESGASGVGRVLRHQSFDGDGRG
jgi:hypothetical protein